MKKMLFIVMAAISFSFADDAWLVWTSNGVSQNDINNTMLNKTVVFNHPVTFDFPTTTFPNNVSITFTNNGCFNLSTNQTVTIQGSLEAPLAQIFQGNGKISFPRVLGTGKKGVTKVYPQWWGADGSDSADDAPAFNLALEAAVKGEIPLEIPSGDYFISAPIKWSDEAPNEQYKGNRITIEGYGATIRSNMGTTQGSLLTIFGPKDLNSDPERHSAGIFIRGLLFVGLPGQNGIHIHSAQYVHIENVTINACNKAILFQNTDIASVRNSNIQNDSVGISQRDTGFALVAGGIANDFVISGNIISGNILYGIDYGGGMGLVIEGNELVNNGTGIAIANIVSGYVASNPKIINNRFEKNINRAIKIGNGSAVRNAIIESNAIIASSNSVVFALDNNSNTIIKNNFIIPNQSGATYTLLSNNPSSPPIFINNTDNNSPSSLNLITLDTGMVGGKVGIGTEKPQKRFHVVGPGDGTSVRFQGDPTDKGIDFRNYNTYACIQGMNSNFSGTGNLVFQESGGYIGIGTTTPGSNLQVSNNAAIGYAASTVAPTNGLAVSGSVGVGTSSPSVGTKLEVAGPVKVTGGDFSVQTNKRVYLDGASNTYLIYTGTYIQLYKNGTKVAQW